MMPRKPNTDVDPRIGNDRVGLMVSRQQVEHLGHSAIKSQMLLDNATNIVASGSSEKWGVPGNPLTPEQKRRAQKGLWGDTFKIVFLQDIGATDRTTDWADYLFDRIRTNQLPEPTDFYAGSVHEARWYEAHFAAAKGEPTGVRGNFVFWENPTTGKRLHILDRTKHLPISSSEVRDLIERRDDAWKSFVPARLWDFYEWEYPPQLRVAIAWDQGGFPDADRHPVGTTCIRATEPGIVWSLRDDGKWRIRDPKEASLKSLGD
jgi:hypothetical protein